MEKNHIIPIVLQENTKTKKGEKEMKKMLKNKKGFTLVEMIVVLAIIAILIALLAPNVARLIRNAQITSDDARAKNVIGASQAFATEQLGNLVPYTNAGNDMLIQLTNANPDGAMIAIWQGTGAVAGDLIGNGGALLPVSAVRGQAVLTLAISSDGVPSGVIYSVNGVIRAVSGDPGPLISAGMPAGTNFDTATLRDGTITNFTAGTPTVVGTPGTTGSITIVP